MHASKAAVRAGCGGDCAPDPPMTQLQLLQTFPCATGASRAGLKLQSGQLMVRVQSACLIAVLLRPGLPEANDAAACEPDCWNRTVVVSGLKAEVLLQSVSCRSHSQKGKGDCDVGGFKISSNGRVVTRVGLGPTLQYSLASPVYT